jgi:hypothetical protein
MMKISAPRISLRMSRSSDDVERLCRGFCAQRLNETREIQIPSDKVGLIIGSRGATIKRLQRDAKKHGAHLELIQPRQQGQAGRVVIKANDTGVADLLEAEVKRTARLIEPDDASTLSAAATAENRRRSWPKDPSFGIVPWTKVGERFYCLVQV